MAQGDFKTTISLGPPGKEMALTDANDAQIVEPFQEAAARVEATAENVVGEAFTEVFSQYAPDFTITLDAANKKTRDAIRAIYAVADTHLSFLYADDWEAISERYILKTPTTFEVRTNPYQRLDKEYQDLALGTIIDNFKVFSDRDMRAGQVTTDFFAGGGTYNRDSRLITLATSPGPAGTVVFMNYTFEGCRVRIVGPPVMRTIRFFDSTGQNRWAIRLRLRAA